MKIGKLLLFGLLYCSILEYAPVVEAFHQTYQDSVDKEVASLVIQIDSAKLLPTYLVQSSIINALSGSGIPGNSFNKNWNTYWYQALTKANVSNAQIQQIKAIMKSSYS